MLWPGIISVVDKKITAKVGQGDVKVYWVVLTPGSASASLCEGVLQAGQELGKLVIAGEIWTDDILVLALMKNSFRHIRCCARARERPNQNT